MRCSDATKDAELPKRVFGQQRVLQQFQAGFWCFQAVILFKNVLLLSHFYTDHPWNVTCHVLSCGNYHIRTLYFIQFRAPLDMALHYNMGDIFHLRIYGDMQFFPGLAWRPCVKSWWRAIRIAWSLNWPLLLGCKAHHLSMSFDMFLHKKHLWIYGIGMIYIDTFRNSTFKKTRSCFLFSYKNPFKVRINDLAAPPDALDPLFLGGFHDPWEDLVFQLISKFTFKGKKYAGN